MSNTTENTNCLKNMACPKCSALEPFDIECFVKKTLTMRDSGPENDASASESWTWDSTSRFVCGSCGHSGVCAELGGVTPS